MRRRPSLTRAFTLLAAVALGRLGLFQLRRGQGGRHQDQAAVVLTLADHEQGPDQVQFSIEEVQRRAGGSLRIQVTNQWRDQQFASNQATIADVQAGEASWPKSTPVPTTPSA
jgi:hypothetical protein